MNIKKLLLITALFSIMLSFKTIQIFAAIPTPSKVTPSPATTTPSTSTSSANKAIDEKLNEQINQLKERIASRVAQLNLVEKRGIISIVKETSGNQVTLTDLSGKTRFVDVDEITKFTSSKNGFGLSDLVKGSKISVLGLYNKQSQRILARFIESASSLTFLSGRIASLDNKNFTIAVMSEGQKQNLVDIETITVISTYSQDTGISKSRFSKLNIGDRVAISGYPDKKDATLLVANRILALPDLPVNPKIIIQEPSVTQDLTPSPQVTRKPTLTKPIQY